MSNTDLDIPSTILAAVMIILAVGSAIAGFMVNPETGEVYIPAGKPAFFAVIITFLYGIGGYLKNTKPETFDSVKFIITLFISVVVSIVVYALNLSYNDAYNLTVSVLTSTGALVLLETWLKVFVRQFQKT